MKTKNALILTAIVLIAVIILGILYEKTIHQHKLPGNALDIIKEIKENKMGYISFHGKSSMDSLDYYYKSILDLKPSTVYIEEYTIYDLSNIPMYEFVFEWTPNVNVHSTGFSSVTDIWGKYREPGGQWGYFRSPETTRQYIRN